MRANSSYEAEGTRSVLEMPVNRAGSPGSRAISLAPGESRSVAGAPLSQARALLIYLRYRGVLNVEEFRRTNTRAP